MDKELLPNTITFCIDDLNTDEIMRISHDGITVNPKYPPEEIAQKVIDILDEHIKHMVSNLKKQPLSDEAIAKVFAELPFAAKPRDITRAVEAAHDIG